MEKKTYSLDDIDIKTPLDIYTAEQLITMIYNELMNREIDNCILTALFNDSNDAYTNDWAKCTYSDLVFFGLNVLSEVLPEHAVNEIKSLISEVIN